MKQWMYVTEEQYAKLEAGKTYRFNGKRGRVVLKASNNGQVSAAGLQGCRPMILVKALTK